MKVKLWPCPRCHKSGFPSIHGSICTDCANELRHSNKIKQAIKDGWLLQNALPLSKQYDENYHKEGGRRWK